MHVWEKSGSSCIVVTILYFSCLFSDDPAGLPCRLNVDFTAFDEEYVCFSCNIFYNRLITLLIYIVYFIIFQNREDRKCSCVIHAKQTRLTIVHLLYLYLGSWILQHSQAWLVSEVMTNQIFKLLQQSYLSLKLLGCLFTNLSSSHQECFVMLRHTM